MIASRTDNIKDIVEEIHSKWGLNQKELALKLNIVPETISRWMTGNHNPREETLADLKNILENGSLDKSTTSIDKSIQTSIDTSGESISIPIKVQDQTVGYIKISINLAFTREA